MEFGLTAKEKIALLNEEVHSLHAANTVYWRETTQTLAAKALYQFRQDRLEEIRSELAQLRASTHNQDWPTAASLLVA